MGILGGRFFFKHNCAFSFTSILRHHFFYSTSTSTSIAAAEKTLISSSNVPPLVNWLVSSLGFSDKQALSTSTKLEKLRQNRGAKEVNFLWNADSVVTFLQQKGLSKPQIQFVVLHVPQILTSRIQQTLKPKLKVFQDLGLSESDVAKFIATQPGILRHSLKSTVSPIVESLKQILGCNEDVIRVLKNLRWRDYPLICKNLVSNVTLLSDRGISMDSIRKNIVFQCYPFIQSTESLQNLMVQIESKWGISPPSPSFLSAICLISCYSEDNIEAKFRVFESFGWTRADVLDLFKRNPRCLRTAEATLKLKLRFFMEELGFDPGYIVTHSALIQYSLKNRVLPRHVVFSALKEEGLVDRHSSFYSALPCSEPVFLSRFVEPFEKVVPDLKNIYVRGRDCSLSKDELKLAC